MLEGCTARDKEGGYCWARGHQNSIANWGARIGWKAIWGRAIVEKPLQEGFVISVGHYETYDHGPILACGILWAPAVL